jgi:hypothetical protein
MAMSCLGVVNRINRKGSRDELQGTENCFQRSICVRNNDSLVPDH